jgi:hypothetical protein
VTYDAAPIAMVASPTSAAALLDHQTLRLDLPATGWYHLSVSGASSPELLSERGPYRVALLKEGITPEVAGTDLVPGDSVTDEAIDHLGDWDEYTVTAPPGQELALLFHSESSVSYPWSFPWVLAFDSNSGDSLAGAVGQNQRLAGPFRIPASGQVHVAVFDRPTEYFRVCYDATCGSIYRYVGAYRVHVIPINRAPETVSAAYTVADTVRGEAIFPAGDIDEFAASAIPGDSLTVWWRLAEAPVPDGSLITLEIVDPATGVILAGGGGWSLNRPSLEFIRWVRFAVPQRGLYLIRVRANGMWGEAIGTAPYHFVITRGQ